MVIILLTQVIINFDLQSTKAVVAENKALLLSLKKSKITAYFNRYTISPLKGENFYFLWDF